MRSGVAPLDPGVEHRDEHVVAALGDAPREVDGRALLPALVLRRVASPGAGRGGSCACSRCGRTRPAAPGGGLVGRAVAPVRAVERTGRRHRRRSTPAGAAAPRRRPRASSPRSPNPRRDASRKRAASRASRRRTSTPRPPRVRTRGPYRSRSGLLPQRVDDAASAPRGRCRALGASASMRWNRSRNRRTHPASADSRVDVARFARGDDRGQRARPTASSSARSGVVEPRIEPDRVGLAEQLLHREQRREPGGDARDERLGASPRS